MPVSAVALMAGAPSIAHAQCFGSMGAITSVIGTVNTAFLPSGSAFLTSAPSSAPDQQGGGVWTRAVGGTVETKSNTSFNGSFNVPPPAGTGNVSVNFPCSTNVRQDFVGFEAGHDIAVLNAANADWHFGVLAGYVGAKVETPAQGVSVNSQGGDVNAPSAGLYTSFSRGAFSADAQARLYDIQSESLGQRLDARGYSLAGNMSYRFDLPGNWTLEPSVGGVFSRTSVDPLNLADVNQTIGVSVPGVAFLGSGSPLSVSGALQIHDIESALGRASVKLGTILPVPGTQIVAYPFITASVFHEFEGTATASLVANGTIPTAAGSVGFKGGGNLTASSIGTYAQVGGGSAFQLAGTGWVGYARVDYRTGDYIEGVSGSAGLRYEFDDPGHGAQSSAHSRMAVKALPTAEGYDWTGSYIGVSAGSNWGHTHWSYPGVGANLAGSVEPDFAGVLAGGQAGYNIQTGRYVWGVEGDLGYSNARGAAGCIDSQFVNCENDLNVLGSLTARFGYTWGRALFYAKGGWAFGEVTTGTSLNYVHAGTPAAVPIDVTQSTNWENGWTAGLGMEFALTDRWSAKAEYMHYEFPQYTFTAAQGVTASASATGDLARVGVNYHFKP